MTTTTTKVYRFRVHYKPFTTPSLRTIRATTYNQALTELYYPASGEQPIDAELIGLEIKGIHKGDSAIRIPGNYDLE
jgi:hypothetical protein